MSSDRTIIEGNAPPFCPADASAPTIIETRPGTAPGSVATIIEARPDGSGFVPFLNLVPGADFLAYRLIYPLKVASAEADLWLIERRADQCKFVLKLYRYGIHPKAEILDALRRLRHEHVVEIIENGAQDGRSFEIQEFVGQGSLADLIRRGPVPEAQVRALLGELADSLAHLHEARVLHRDIKPSNILIRSWQPLDLVLTDFGISSLAESALHLTNVSRTAAYCAPEAMTGVVAKASDWWSVGVIAVELLTGRHPLAGMNEQVINFQLVSKGLPLPADLPATWLPLVKGLLTRDHEKRWGAAQIKAWLGGDASIPVHFERETPPAVPAPGRMPFKFGDQEFTGPRELAAALAQQWDLAVKRCSLGMLASWAQSEWRDPGLASALSQLSLEFKLNPDQKLAVAVLLLNRELPFIFKGQVVDLNWCQQHASEALALAQSPLLKWLKRLKKEGCLEPWVAQWEARKRELDQFGLPLDAALVERLLAAPDLEVISACCEQRRQYAGARHARLEALLSQPELTFTEAVAFLACDRAWLLTTADKSQWDKSARLKALGAPMDWLLAERLIGADNWDVLRPLWEECLALWRRRRRTYLPLSQPRLETILNEPAPDYLDAVAVVANRLDFVNSLGMRFVTVSGLGVLVSAWATRVQDYAAFMRAMSRAWKSPPFAQTPMHPAVNVSWEDATAFCQWLTNQERQEGRIGHQDEYRLPYDLEWSHAIGLENEGGHLPVQRAGKVQGVYPWGTQWPPPDNVANVGGAVGRDAFTHTAPVGSFAPNRHGLHDLGSNVCEWCWDWYDANQQVKTIRGASWFQSTPDNLLASARRYFVPDFRSDGIGFRCVLVARTFKAPEQPPPAPAETGDQPAARSPSP